MASANKEREITESPALPLVNIGMPLYNEQSHLRKALDSILAQDYCNFDLIISDNTSEDATRAISQEYAARDSRIGYRRNERNLGSLSNFSQVFLVRSAVVTLCGRLGHDLRAPSMLSKCVQALERNPWAVLCCPGMRASLTWKGRSS